MRWRDGRRSGNIEDRRGAGGRGGLPGGFRLPRSRGVRRGGIGGFGLIVVIVLALLFGFDPSALLQGVQGTGPATQIQRQPAGTGARAPGGDRLKAFVSVVLGSTEDTWAAIFSGMNQRYQPPKLVLYEGVVRTACGTGQSAAGPFYCPGDRKIYLDLGFFRQLETRFNAPGDFAQAYVVAHEVGHHVQTLMGIARKVQSARQRSSRTQSNRLQMMMELQADCLAGVWARNADDARGILEQGDIEEGIGAASAVGDDTLQRRSRGYVVPDSFTHGSSTQRVRWFKRGLAAGNIRDCNTFNASQL